MSLRLTCVRALVVGAVLMPSSATAQTGSIELGVDALSVGGDFTGNLITAVVPVRTLRAGFFVSDRVSVEPQMAFEYVNFDGFDFWEVTLGVGSLLHLRRRPTRFRGYVRPLVTLNVSDTGKRASQIGLGAGVGGKIRLLERLALRLELVFGHAFGNEEFAGRNDLAGIVGVSFFTR